MATKRFKSLITEERLNQAYQKLLSDSDIAVEDGRFVIVRPERYAAAIKIMEDHFKIDEPLGRCIGLVSDHEFEAFILDTLKQHMSLALVSPQDEIIGLLLLGVKSRTDVFDTSGFKNVEFLQILAVLEYVNKQVDVYELFDVEDLIHFVTIAVKKDFRQKGIGRKLVKAAIAFIKYLDLGSVVVKAEATSKFSQRIGEELGFETLAELAYDYYKVDGKVVFKNMGVHTCLKLSCGTIP